MDERDRLAERFDEHRTRLRAVAYRMLGPLTEADDAVQEAWLRLSRSDTGSVENLGGWLTTVTARVCLDMLRARKSRREELHGVQVPEPVVPVESGSDPEHEAVLGDSIGLALLVVLETLDPDERLAFVLHDMFAVPFEEIAPIVGRSPAAARQLASRARRRVQGTEPVSELDAGRQREIVKAFLAAAREGDFTALLEMLDPDVVLRADGAAVRMGSTEVVRGSAAVAETFSGRAKVARPAMIDGAAGLVWSQGGKPRVVFGFAFAHGKIIGIELIADDQRLSEFDLVMLES